MKKLSEISTIRFLTSFKIQYQRSFAGQQKAIANLELFEYIELLLVLRQGLYE